MLLNTPFPFRKVIRHLRMLKLTIPKLTTSSGFPQIKIITSLQKKYNVDILVETGTYLGEMIQSQLNNFEEIYSIELNEILYQKAVKRFQLYPKVKLIQGDSAKELIYLIPKIKKKSIFYLDNIFQKSKQTIKKGAILEDLRAIFQSEIKDHILVIRSIKLFDLEKEIPSFKELFDFILKYRPKSKTILKHDLFIVIPS